MAVSDWQTTADDNTDVDGIDISKGFPARNVGAAFRNIMADTKAALDRISFTALSILTVIPSRSTGPKKASLRASATGTCAMALQARRICAAGLPWA